jgi:hypothetical protein
MIYMIDIFAEVSNLSNLVFGCACAHQMAGDIQHGSPVLSTTEATCLADVSSNWPNDESIPVMTGTMEQQCQCTVGISVGDATGDPVGMVGFISQLMDIQGGSTIQSNFGRSSLRDLLTILLLV